MDSGLSGAFKWLEPASDSGSDDEGGREGPGIAAGAALYGAGESSEGPEIEGPSVAFVALNPWAEPDETARDAGAGEAVNLASTSGAGSSAVAGPSGATAAGETASGSEHGAACFTPTFKLKRPQLLKRYGEQVDAMYTALGEDPSKYKRV
jgi:hypothetical protein